MTLLFLYLAIAIGVSFLCSVLEAVLLSVTPSFAEALLNDRPQAGQVLGNVQSRMDESLSAILILNTFAHTMGAAGVGAQAMVIFGPQWETLVAVVLTLVILYFSEIIPKTLGATYWKKLAIPASWAILGLIRMTLPLVWLATLVTGLLGKKTSHEITRDEVLAMVSLGKKNGNLFEEESEYLTNLLSLRDIATESIITPRSVVHMLDKNMTVAEALSLEDTKRFSRMPVFGENVDDIPSVVLLKDLYEASRLGQNDIKVESIAKPIEFVSEKLPVHRLLDLFIKRRNHILLVQDEFGQTTGIVTLEDAIETLLGREIVDESDSVVDMQALARDRFRTSLQVKKARKSDC